MSSFEDFVAAADEVLALLLYKVGAELTCMGNALQGLVVGVDV